jgi:hypothetical protein
VKDEIATNNIHDIHHHHSKGQRTKNNITPDATATGHNNSIDISYNDDDIVNSPSRSNKNTHAIIQDLLEHSSIKRVDSNSENSINQFKNSSSNTSYNSTSTSHKNKGSMSISITKSNNNKIPMGRMDVVTLDRPSHWMKSSLKPTATHTLKTGSSSSSSRRGAGGGAGGNISPMRKKISTVHQQSSWNRPRDYITTPSSAATVAVARPVVSLDNISTLCFRPSWMVSPTTKNNIISSSSSSNGDPVEDNDGLMRARRNNIDGGSGGIEGMRAIDAIQDDFDDHTINKSASSSSRSTHHHHHQHRSPFNDTFSPDRTIRNSSSSALSKAKPGTLKAKLLKLFREADSIDTWMRNFSSSGHKSMERDPNRHSSIDLQDPRNRATHYIEFELMQKLPDRYPFQVFLMRVLSSWHHHHHHARDKSATSHVLDEQLLAQESGMQDCLNASIFNKPTASDELYKEGSDLVGYFTGPRDNGCGNTVGSNKALVEGLCIRIYEPYVMPFINSSKGIENIVMCTSFWDLSVA